MGRNDSSLRELDDNRPKKRLVELIEKIAIDSDRSSGSSSTCSISSSESCDNSDDNGRKGRIIEFKYLLSPANVSTVTSKCSARGTCDTGDLQ